MAHPHKLKIKLVESSEQSSLTVVYAGKTYIASDSHPAWKKLRELALADDPEVIKLFDVAKTLERHALSERVSAAGGTLYFDNDKINGALADLIIRLVAEKEDPKALVAYLENCKENPDPSSVEQLYDFVKDGAITITDDGLLVAYKAVLQKDGYYESNHSGFALVNGKPVEGRVPQRVGDVVEMPRSQVRNDPHNACSVGLHVATFKFARDFLPGGVILEVHVNPRDVVSVPSYEKTKVRVCRYKIVGTVTRPHEKSVVHHPPRPPRPPRPPHDAAQGPPVTELERKLIQRAPKLSPHAVQAHAEPAGIERRRGGDHLSTTVKPRTGRIPTVKEFNAMVAKAKAQKTGVARYLTRRHWTLVSGDGSRAGHWRLPATSAR